VSALKVVAIASRDLKKAQQAAEQLSIRKAYPKPLSWLALGGWKSEYERRKVFSHIVEHAGLSICPSTLYLWNAVDHVVA
jgi:hypothetical protein